MEYKLILHAKIFQVFSLSVNLSMKKKKKKKSVREQVIAFENVSSIGNQVATIAPLAPETLHTPTRDFPEHYLTITNSRLYVASTFPSPRSSSSFMCPFHVYQERRSF
jgi:hypothetical protein